MVRLVLSNLHPGAEAVRTEGKIALSALDPHQAGLVDIVSTPNTEELLTEVERHPLSQYYLQIEFSSTSN